MPRRDLRESWIGLWRRLQFFVLKESSFVLIRAKHAAAMVKLQTIYKHTDGSERPVTVEIHPSYGQPSVLAYKIVQAVFLKYLRKVIHTTDYVTFRSENLHDLSDANGPAN